MVRSGPELDGIGVEGAADGELVGVVGEADDGGVEPGVVDEREGGGGEGVEKEIDGGD